MCVFLLEHSKLSRYGENCERIYGMFKHTDIQNEEEKSELNENGGDGKVENFEYHGMSTILINTNKVSSLLTGSG